MKEKDLYVDFKPQQAVYYVEKDDSTYGPIVSGSQISHDYLEDYFFKKKNLEKQLRDQMADNKISPVYYYMTLYEMGIGDLASRVRVSKRKLKKHFLPKYFEKLSIPLLKRYAAIFDIPLASMFQLVIVKQEDQVRIEFDFMKTKNDCLIITKTGIRKNEKSDRF